MGRCDALTASPAKQCLSYKLFEPREGEPRQPKKSPTSLIGSLGSPSLGTNGLHEYMLFYAILVIQPKAALVYVHALTCVYIYIYMQVCIDVYIHAVYMLCVCTCMCICRHTLLSTYTHIYMYICKYVYMYIYMYIYI